MGTFHLSELSEMKFVAATICLSVAICAAIPTDVTLDPEWLAKQQHPAVEAYAAARAAYPASGYFSFTFTGDGCNGQCPKSGCYQEDLDCEYCLAAWRANPPDSSYKYNPIVSHGCNGTKVDCPECQGMMGLSRYDH